MFWLPEVDFLFFVNLSVLSVSAEIQNRVFRRKDNRQSKWKFIQAEHSIEWFFFPSLSWLKCVKMCMLNSVTTAISTTGVTRGSLWVWRWHPAESTRSTRSQTEWFAPMTTGMWRDSLRFPTTRGASASSTVASADWWAFRTFVSFYSVIHEKYSRICKLSAFISFSICLRRSTGMKSSVVPLSTLGTSLASHSGWGKIPWPLRIFWQTDWGSTAQTRASHHWPSSWSRRSHPDTGLEHSFVFVFLTLKKKKRF